MNGSEDMGGSRDGAPLGTTGANGDSGAGERTGRGPGVGDDASAERGLERLYLVFPAPEPVTLLYTGRFIGEDGWSHASRTLNNNELILMDEGELHLSVDGTDLAAREGDVVLVPRGSHMEGTRPSPAGTSFYWLHFLTPREARTEDVGSLPELAQGLADEPLLLVPRLSRTLNAARLRVLFSQLLDVAQRTTPSNFFLNYCTTTLLMEITDEVASEALSQGRDGEMPRTILFIMEWMRLNLDRPITLETVAREFGYNKSYLSRTFSAHVGCTLTQYLLRVRVEKAKSLLLGTALPVEGIAPVVGIPDEKYFMRLFKRSEGVTPTQYRTTYRHTRLNKH